MAADRGITQTGATPAGRYEANVKRHTGERAMSDIMVLVIVGTLALLSLAWASRGM